jgi:stage IV sporulation protein FA
MKQTRTSFWFYFWSVLLILAGCWAFLQWNHPLAERARTNLEGIVQTEVNWNVLNDWYAKYVDASPVIVPVIQQQKQESDQAVSGSAISFHVPTEAKLWLPFNSNRQGVLFRSSQSTVHNLADGRVIHIGPMTGMGEVVIVQHAGGIQSWFGMLNRIDVKKNDWLALGETIGEAVHLPENGGYALFVAIKDGEVFRNPFDVMQVD